MNAREIRQMRKKFIVIAMISIFMAMAFICVMVNLLTHAITQASVYRTLDALIAGAEEGNYDTVFIDDINGEGPSFSDIFSPQYRRNHYYVFRAASGETLAMMFTNTHNESEIEAIDNIAAEISEKDSAKGHYGSYYYKVKAESDGSTIVAILEGSVIFATELRTFYASLAICLIGLIITFFLVRHFSEAAIRPEIENSMRQKQFITNASHELKTPLAVIRANTEMLEIINGESEWTDSTLRQVDRLNGLIQNLVMIARSEEKEDRSELSEIDVSRAVNESIDPYEIMAMQSGKTIERKIDNDVRIRADESNIRQLAALLVDNAMKYCDDGGIVKITLSGARAGKGLRLIVSNDYKAGGDIDCSRFFDRFYREDDSHNIDTGGYGIGLSIAESICRQYDGDIRAEWNEGIISFICDL